MVYHVKVDTHSTLLKLTHSISCEGEGRQWFCVNITLGCYDMASVYFNKVSGMSSLQGTQNRICLPSKDIGSVCFTMIPSLTWLKELYGSKCVYFTKTRLVSTFTRYPALEVSTLVWHRECLL